MTQGINLLVWGDLFLAVLALYSAATLGMHRDYPIPVVTDFILFALTVGFSSYFIELYNPNKIYSFSAKERTATIILGLVVSFFALSTIFFMVPSEAFQRHLLVITLFVFGIFQISWHFIYISFVNHDSMAQRVLVLGQGNIARIMERIILLKQANYVFAGYYDVPGDEGTQEASKQVQCLPLMEYVKKEKINKLVMALTERRGSFPFKELLGCKFVGVEIVDAPSFYEEIMGKLLIENITPGWFIYGDGFKLDAKSKFIKRLSDICFSILGLMLSLPLFPLIGVLVKIDSKGPIFYRQTRVGESQKHFQVIKFRTMKTDAETGGAVWAQKNDCRVTKVGKILRKIRFDEIPQFINVLKGDMSLIGPRPERPEFVEKLKKIIPYYGYRHFVKPGITGWAQIKYPYGSSEEDAMEKLRYDLYYIKKLSPRLDIVILLDTIKVVLFGKGAR